MRFFLALLTTLFVSAMPLQAAYANTPTTQTTLNLVTNEQACVSYESSVTAEVRQTIADQGGVITELVGKEAQALLERIEELVGSNPPYPVDQIVVVQPTADAEAMNIGLFSEGCLKGFFALPAEIVRIMFGVTAKAPQGEKVD